jgi:acyl carrier protein
MRGTTANDRPDLEKSVVEWLRTELADPEVTAADNFLDIGGHSFMFANLNAFLSKSFGLVLDQKVTYSEELGTAVAAMQPELRNPI